MQLLRLEYDAICNDWDLLWEKLRETLPEFYQTEECSGKILWKILSGQMDCWAGYDDEKLYVIVFTMNIADQITSHPSLLIYSICFINEMGKEDWETGFETLRKYAIGKGCKTMMFHTKFPKIVAMAKKLGMEEPSYVCNFTLS